MTFEIFKIINWMKQYIQESNTKGYIVGLSGGIDSSVTASLAVQAIGKENVIGILMPCESSPESLTDAKELVKKLEIRYEIIDLEETYHSIVKSMPIKINKLVKANIKARLRMTTLYAIAGKCNYIVAGTGNKSELEIGYATKFGDGGVDIEPLGNYYKTEVYEIASKLDEIPNQIKTKKPSADLWDGQTDEEELGMTYKELDKILYALEQNSSKERDSIPLQKLLKVAEMKRKAQHKNEVPPRCPRD